MLLKPSRRRRPPSCTKHIHKYIHVQSRPSATYPAHTATIKIQDPNCRMLGSLLPSPWPSSRLLALSSSHCWRSRWGRHASSSSRCCCYLILSLLVPLRRRAAASWPLSSAPFSAGPSCRPFGVSPRAVFPISTAAASTRTCRTVRGLSSSGWRFEEEGLDPSQEMSGKEEGKDKAAAAAATRSEWTVCGKCDGEGKLKFPPSRKARLRHKRARTSSSPPEGDRREEAPPPPAPRIEPCGRCQGSGLAEARSKEAVDRESFPEVAIVGGGLAGLALAAACRHRGIPYAVYERDLRFSQRAQGYGLTMQQASRALKGFGIATTPLVDGVTSTRHLVHRPDGTVVGSWGLRVWGRSNAKSKKEPKRQNVHVPRQSLRYQLLQLSSSSGSGGGGGGGTASSDEGIFWNHKLLSFREAPAAADGGECDDDADNNLVLTFQVGDEVVEKKAGLLVGADGIRSSVREQLVGSAHTPLRYLGCIVILGICPIADILAAAQKDETKKHADLLDGETVFQTADGTTRIYMMPYSDSEYMWQLSFPMEESSASTLSGRGPAALKDVAASRCKTWHFPIADILFSTPEELVSGYPVYDRALLTVDSFEKKTSSKVTLIGDACHPMSPFKGQGANQALLDALSLARTIYSTKKKGKCSLQRLISDFEREMLDRSSVKVKASAQAAHFLHTDVAISEGDVTRGAANRKHQQQKDDAS